MVETKKFWTVIELQAMFGNCAKSTIYKKIRDEGFPKPVRFGNRNLFPIPEVRAWMRVKFGRTLEDALPAVEPVVATENMTYADLFGRNLRRRMEAKSWGVPELSDRSGVGKAALYYVWTRHSIPRDDALKKIAAALECSKFDLIAFIR